MKDGTTHLAYKPEHAVDLDTGVIVAAPIHLMWASWASMASQASGWRSFMIEEKLARKPWTQCTPP